MRYIPDVKTAGLAALCNDYLVMRADSLSIGMLYILCWAMCDTVGVHVAVRLVWRSTTQDVGQHQ